MRVEREGAEKKKEVTFPNVPKLPNQSSEPKVSEKSQVG